MTNNLYLILLAVHILIIIVNTVLVNFTQYFGLDYFFYI